jgi:hypothetical protein
MKGESGLSKFNRPLKPPPEGCGAWLYALTSCKSTQFGNPKNYVCQGWWLSRRLVGLVNKAIEGTPLKYTLSIPYKIKHIVNDRQNGLARVHFCYSLDVIGGPIRIGP